MVFHKICLQNIRGFENIVYVFNSFFSNRPLTKLSQTVHKFQNVNRFVCSYYTKNEIQDTNSIKNKKRPVVVSEDMLSFEKKRIFVRKKRKGSFQALQYIGEMLYGVHPVYVALMQKRREFYHLYMKNYSSIEDSYWAQSELRDKIRALATALNVKFSIVDLQTLNLLAPGAVHQGVCLDTSEYSLLEFEEKKYSYENFHPLWLVLHDIQDPMNIGAIFRSSFYFGVDKILLTNSCSKLSPAVSKASAGALEAMDIHRIHNLKSFLENRKSEGWCIVSSVAANIKSKFSNFLELKDFELSKPTVLVLGNESIGVSELVHSYCDFRISVLPEITIQDTVDSLNVSVATGIMLYHLLNKQKIKDS